MNAADWLAPLQVAFTGAAAFGAVAALVYFRAQVDQIREQRREDRAALETEGRRRDEEWHRSIDPMLVCELGGPATPSGDGATNVARLSVVGQYPAYAVRVGVGNPGADRPYFGPKPDPPIICLRPNAPQDVELVLPAGGADTSEVMVWYLDIAGRSWIVRQEAMWWNGVLRVLGIPRRHEAPENR